MSAYGTVKGEAGQGAAIGVAGEAFDGDAAPTVLGLRSRAVTALGVAAGVALAGTAAIAATGGAPLVSTVGVVTDPADLREGGKHANNGWDGRDQYAKEGHKSLDWLNKDEPRTDQVQSFRELANSNNDIDFMGAAVTYSSLTSMGGYAGNHSYMYNLLTASNECKWNYLYNTDYEECDYINQYALENDIQFRFHTLVWLAGGIPTWLQDEYDNGKLTKERKKHILGTHIKNTTQRYAGTVWAYDVVNEAICDFGYLCYPENNCSDTVYEKWNGMGRVTDRGVWENTTSDCVYSEYYGTWLKSSIWLDGTPETDYVAFIDDAFHIAYDNDPGALLCYNDYKYESRNTFEDIKSNEVFKFLTRMKDRGVPVNCVGQQTHIDITYINRTRWVAGYKENMGRLASLGSVEDPMTLMVTEFDAKCSDDHADLPCYHWGREKEESQAQLYASILAVCMQTKECKSFESWGWTDAVDFAASDDEYGDRHPFPFDSNFRAKPAYYYMQHMLSASGGGGEVAPTPSPTLKKTAVHAPTAHPTMLPAPTQDHADAAENTAYPTPHPTLNHADAAENTAYPTPHS